MGLDRPSIAKVVPPPLLVCVELNPGPGKMSTSKRERVIGFLESGASPTKAAEHFEVDISSITRLQENKRNRKCCKQTGTRSKKKIIQKDERKVKRQAKSGKTSREIALN